MNCPHCNIRMEYYSNEGYYLCPYCDMRLDEE